jgi:CheY-like chemotaxis protein
MLDPINPLKVPAPSPDFVAKATSELNNLLQIISGTSSAIEAITKDTEGAAKYLDMLRSSIDRAEKIAAELSVEAGGPEKKFIFEAGITPLARIKKSTKSMPAKPTIMLVDDEAMALSLQEHTLGEAGFNVVAAKSGFECLDLLRRHPNRFAMILLDLSLPFMDGEETFRRLRNIRTDVPVVLCTGFIQEERLNRMMGAGLCGFLRKPISADELVALVHSILENVRYAQSTRGAEMPAVG